MPEFLQGFHPAVQALFGTGFTWGMTALGAATIFVPQANRQGNTDQATMIGFAVMMTLDVAFG